MKLGRITLLRPNMGNYRTLDAFPPLVMAILAARTPHRIEIRFYDDRLEAPPIEEQTDLVAMSVETFSARRAYLLADAYRKRGVPVVMGGHHPTLLPEEAMRHADALLLGDAEGIWEEMIDDFRSGTLKQIYRHRAEEAAEPTLEYKMDRRIFEEKPYRWADLVQYGRGCHHHCSFCSIHAFYGKTIAHHPVENIAREIAAMKQRRPGRLLMFVDDNLYSSADALEALLDEIRPLGVKWACQISADVVRHSRIMDKLAASGCQIALIGFESIDRANIDAMRKGWTRACGDNFAVVREFHSRGIAVCGTFIFGYDGDNADTIAGTLDFIKRAQIELAQLNPLIPLPGTPFYEKMQREGRILHPGWWVDPQYRYGDPIIAPWGMDPDEFARLCFGARKQFYSWRAILRRTVRPGAGFRIWRSGMMALANLLSRHEIYRKQFRFIGE